MLDTKSGQNELMFLLENKVNMTEIFETIGWLSEGDVQIILKSSNNYSFKF